MTDGLRFLIVDDNPDDRLLVRRKLVREFESALVVEAFDAESLSAALADGPYHAVVTDFQLNFSDGLEVLRTVKREAPNCPVLMFTGTGNEEVAVEAMKAGLDDYIVKSPRHFARLAAAVRRSVSRVADADAARATAERFRNLFEGMPVGLYVSTPDGRILEANPTLVRILGAPDTNALLSLRSSDLYADEEDRRSWQERMEREGVVRDFTARIRRLDGKPLYVRETSRAVTDEEGRIVRYEGTMEDITDRKGMEETLQRREAALEAVAFAAERLLFTETWSAAAPEILARLGEATGVSRVYVFENHRLESGEAGCSVRFEWCEEGIEPCLDNPDMHSMPWENSPVERWGEILRQNRVFSGLAADVPEPELQIFGAQNIRSMLLVPIFVDDEWWGLIGFDECHVEREWAAAEVDALRLAGGALSAAIRRERAEGDRVRLEKAVEQAGESIVITDTAGTIRYVNPEFTKVTGYAGGEVVGQNPRILKSGRHPEEFYREMWETLANGGVWSGRLVNQRKDGSHFQEEATISPIRDAAGETVSYVAVKRDVTEDVALRRELMQAQKMESIGRLASGIAHDFNNLMGQILGAAEMILCRARESGLEEYLELIFEAVNRGRNITSRMLNFSRAGEEGVEAVAVGEILTDLEQVGKHTFPKEIELRFDAEEEIHLQCDRTQIQQVLMNLCINAVDAMPGGGMLSVRARRATTDETRRHGNGRGERYACLMVSDSGTGIDSEVVHEIFDPFFTSKPPGKGTGLGLFIVYGIIRSHGGWIEVDTADGSGTTFTLGLPVTGAPVDSTSETSPALPEGVGQHILVVDDEAGLVQLLTEVLCDANYRVSSAGDGREALAFFEANAYDIDLVITDIGMPRMGGRDLVERLRRIDGGLDIIVTSGFVDASDFAELARFGVRKVLTKPFEVDEVLRTVGEVFLASIR